MTEPEVIDFDTTCRTCMINNSNYGFIQLFRGPLSCKHSHAEILEEILFFNLGLWEHDGLPQQICRSCFDTFVQICEFRKQCNAVQDNLVAYCEKILKVPEEMKLEIERINSSSAADIVCRSDSSSSEKDLNEDAEYIEGEYELNDEENNHIENEVVEGAVEVDTMSSYSCNFCKNEYYNESHLSEHIQQCPNRRIEICDYCTNEFESAEMLEAHMKKEHPDSDKLVCPVCYCTFKSAERRNIHINKVHHTSSTEPSQDTSSTEPFQCPSCERSFKAKYYLKKHEQRFHSTVEHECSVCQQKFTNIFRYKYHIETHKEKKRFQCDYCDKSFMQVHHKINHETKHTGARPHLCNICGKGYKSVQPLQEHLARHKGISRVKKVKKKPTEKFNCNICSKELSSKHTLQAHIRRHTDPDHRPFECDKCNKAYVTKPELQLHKYRMHSVPRPGGDNSTGENTRTYPFSCSVCSKGFLVAYALADHVKTHSEDRKFICGECGIGFKRQAHLNAHTNHIHLKLREHHCDLCDRSFVTKSDLKGHRLIHTDEKPFKCTFCPKAFKWKNVLIVHQRTHTGEKPYPCEICGKRFISNQTLMCHSMTHADDDKKLVQDNILAELKNTTEDCIEIEEI